MSTYFDTNLQKKKKKVSCSCHVYGLCQTLPPLFRINMSDIIDNTKFYK